MIAVRERQPDDLPELVRQLGLQQPQSRYPFRWPLPMPTQQFIQRDGELAAWSGLVDGRVMGHVSLTTIRGASIEGDEVVRGFVNGTGRTTDELACVSALFTGPDGRGLGLGRALLETAVAECRRLGRQPVLDVLPAHEGGLRLYRKTGWVEIGHARPEWLDPSEPATLLMTLPAPGLVGPASQ